MKKQQQQQTIKLFVPLYFFSQCNQLDVYKNEEVNIPRVHNIYSIFSSDFTIYTTQAHPNRQQGKKMNKNSYMHTHIQTQSMK